MEPFRDFLLVQLVKDTGGRKCRVPMVKQGKSEPCATESARLVKLKPDSFV